MNVLTFPRQIIKSRNKSEFSRLVCAFDWSTNVMRSDPESSYNTFHERLSKFCNQRDPNQNVWGKYPDIKKKTCLNAEIENLTQEICKMPRKYSKKL